MKVKLVLSVRKVKGLISSDHAVRIDFVNPFLCDIYFKFPNCLSRCQDLSVDVGQAYPVVIDQIQCTDTGACKGLYHVTAHTAYTKYGYAAGSKLLHGCLAIQELRS